MKSEKVICKDIFLALSDYLDGELDPKFCSVLEEHMRDCPPCIAFLKSLKKTIEVTNKAQSDAGQAPEISGEVREKLRSAYEQFRAKLNSAEGRKDR